MGSIPLPALSIQPPPQTDLLGNLGKVMALKNMIQQQQYEQQLQPLQLQKTQFDLDQARIRAKGQQALTDNMVKAFAPQDDQDTTAAAAAPDTTQQAPPSAVPPTPPPGAAPPTAPLSTLAPPPDGSAPPQGPPPPPQGPPPGTAPLASPPDASQQGFIGPPPPPPSPPPDQTQQAALSTAPQPVQKPVPTIGNFLDTFQKAIVGAARDGAQFDQVMDAYGKVLTQQDTFTKMTEAQQKITLAQTDAAGELAFGLQSADPAKQAAIWAQDQQAMALMGPKAAALQYGAGVASYVMNTPYPGPQVITQHMGGLQLTRAMLKDQADKIANQTAAQKLAFPDDTRQQENERADAQVVALTGQHIPVQYLLKPGDGQLQADNLNNMIKTIAESPDVKAGVAGAEAKARLPYELAKTTAEANVHAGIAADTFTRNEASRRAESDVYKPYNAQMDRIAAAQAALDQARKDNNPNAAKAALASLVTLETGPGNSRLVRQIWNENYGSLAERAEAKVKDIFTGSQFTQARYDEAQQFIDSQAQVATDSANRKLGQIGDSLKIQGGMRPVPAYQPKAPQAIPPPTQSNAPAQNGQTALPGAGKMLTMDQIRAGAAKNRVSIQQAMADAQQKGFLITGQ